MAPVRMITDHNPHGVKLAARKKNQFLICGTREQHLHRRKAHKSIRTEEKHATRLGWNHTGGAGHGSTAGKVHILGAAQQEPGTSTQDKASER
jgi:hypothetical protein